eukprot:6949100-Prymnesium_polylepis.1
MCEARRGVRRGARAARRREAAHSHATKKNQKRTSPPVVPGVACVIAMAARIWTRDVAASISGKGTL